MNETIEPLDRGGDTDESQRDVRTGDVLALVRDVQSRSGATGYRLALMTPYRLD